MTETEADTYRARIRTSASIDEWAAIDRELRRHPDAGTDVVQALMRDLERRCAPFTQNAVMRALASDADGYDIAAFLELMEQAPDVDPDDPRQAVRAAAWQMTRFAHLLQDQPGRFQDLRRRVLAAGPAPNGHEFTFSDLMDDPDMSLVLRETEMVADNIQRWSQGFTAALDFEGSAVYQEHATAVTLSLDGEPADIEVALREMSAAIAGGTLTDEEVHHLHAVETWAIEQPLVTSWIRNTDIAMAVQNLTDRLGTEEMQEIARYPYGMRARMTLERLLGELQGPGADVENPRLGRGRGPGMG